MMVTVAKSLEIPVKLLFPRPAPPGSDPAIQGLSMLGLGDVVLPGIMIGLALRFDLFLFYSRKQKKVTNQEIPSESASERSRSSSITQETDAEMSHTIASSQGNYTTAVTTKAHTDDKIIKATYASVAETLGDRFWTSRLLFSNIPKGFVPRGSFPKTYFHASLVGYVLGMVTTLVAMQISAHPQPALLYLVPGVLTSLWGTAWMKGEVKQMWEFTEAAEEEGQTEKEKAKEKKKTTTQEKRIDAEPEKLSSTTDHGDKTQDMTAQEKSETPAEKKPKATEKWFTFSVILPPIARTQGASIINSGVEQVSTFGNHSISTSRISERPDEHLGKRRRVA